MASCSSEGKRRLDRQQRFGSDRRPARTYANYPPALQLHAMEGKVGRTTRKKGNGAFPLVVQALASAEVDIPDCGMELAAIESPGRDTTDTRNGQKPQDVIDRTVDEIHPSK
jgi:hypothetical protein